MRGFRDFTQLPTFLTILFIFLPVEILSFTLAVPKSQVVLLSLVSVVIKAYSHILAAPEFFHCFFHLWAVEAYSNN
jgi:hypothetical protein